MIDKFLLTALIITLALLGHFVWRAQHTESLDTYMASIGAPPELIEHGLEFEDKKIIQVKEDVYVAVNFGVSNSIMLVGPSGVVIVDTLESITGARAVAAEFRNITDKPIKAIVFTHHHPDHTSGAKAFIQEGQTPPEIWAHHKFPAQKEQVFNTGNAFRVRARQQFGFDITSGFLNSGIGGRVRYEEGSTQLNPTRLIGDDDMEVTFGGVNLQFFYMPGETDDQISVWLPDKRVLLVGDNIYKSFPNLYAIRGTAPRDVSRWANTLDKMRKLRPECIIGSHYKPLCGVKEVYELLSDYMYGIQYVHDQTVRFINKGMHPDEIADRVKLPPELARHPYLGQFYGNVPWSVKGVYISYLGWFSGFAEELNPLTPTDRAEKMVELVGKSGLLSAAEAALNKGDHQWALELASHVHWLEPNNARAIELRRQALGELAARQMSANGRNFYMEAMLNDIGGLNKDVEVALVKLPTAKVFLHMRNRLIVEDLPEGERLTGCFHFTDDQDTICATIHKGIMEIEVGDSADYSFKMTSTQLAFKEVIAGSRAVTDGAVQMDGGVDEFDKFMRYLEL